jgi:hypothetical protein
MKGKGRRGSGWQGSQGRTTPTTMPSLSFASQEIASSDLSRLPEKPRICPVRDFHSTYLDCGFWPDLSPRSQASLRSKYLHLRVAHHSLSEDNERLRRIAVTPTPCGNCQAMLQDCKATKQALEEALELSSALLREVLRR